MKKLLPSGCYLANMKRLRFPKHKMRRQPVAKAHFMFYSVKAALTAEIK
ncbi:hypothetical protein PO124_23065 [Bacillus licheniformis]|nr:hypothetical protein [Bacillus licheniformis]